MDSQKQQAAERIKEANNILVTVSSNPSVDQLAACIGLTLSLNKMGKHATAVFSGAVPSTIEFLQPEKTIEKNTDSLRDFIIALDKSKADKLRYKVEDRVVKIFITPYRTSINEKDLEFSQGDFNVDVIVALGVHSQADLDQAITSHGRILHDATVVTVNVKPGGELGGINWLDPNASSLSELGLQLVDVLDKKLVDSQIATAFLTGIVAETERFSNAKTSPQTMSASAELMGAGANQQLVATKLEEPAAPPPPPPAAPIANQESAKDGEPEAAKKPDDGTLEIAHDETPKPEDIPAHEDAKPQDTETKPSDDTPKEQAKDSDFKEEKKPEPETPEPEKPAESELPMPQPEPEEKQDESSSAGPAPQIHIDEHGALQPLEPEAALLPPKKLTVPEISHHDEPLKMIIQPTMGTPTDASPLTMPDTPAPALPTPPPAIIKRPAPMALEDNTTTIKPTASDGDNELPSGAAPAESFLVGGQPTIIPPTQPAPEPKQEEQPKSEEKTPEDPGKTLSDLERDVNSSHLDLPSTPGDSSMPASGSPLNSLPPIQPQPAAPQAAPASPAPGANGNPMFADDILSTLGIPSDPGPSPSPAPSPFSSAQPNAVTLPPMNGPAGGNDTPLVQPPTDNSTPVEEHPTVDSARDAVAQAISGSMPQLEPVQALNAQPVDLALPGANPGVQPAPAVDAMSLPPAVGPAPMLPGMDMGQGPVVSGPQTGMPDLTLPGMQMPSPDQTDPNAPPPVPPPMMPPTNPY